MMLTKEKESNTLTKEVTHDLIRGEFMAEEAAEIVNHMLTTKINFHERKNFSSQIRFGQNDEFSLTRIKELQDSENDISNLIESAKTNNQNLRISSTITIELI